MAAGGAAGAANGMAGAGRRARGGRRREGAALRGRFGARRGRSGVRAGRGVTLGGIVFAGGVSSVETAGPVGLAGGAGGGWGWPTAGGLARRCRCPDPGAAPSGVYRGVWCPVP